MRASATRAAEAFVVRLEQAPTPAVLIEVDAGHDCCWRALWQDLEAPVMSLLIESSRQQKTLKGDREEEYGFR
jgi:hypothetical protein